MKKSKLMYMAVAFCTAVFLFSGAMLAKDYHDSKQSEAVYEELSVSIKTEEGIRPYEYYRDIYTKNDDMIGWLRIPGTDIDYPVMQTVDSPDFYLDHGFDGQKSVYGALYVQENCSILNSDNLIIYGHNMKDGKMFSDLCRYADKSFYNDHRIIYFDTLDIFGTYEIVYVFRTEVYKDGCFKYYNFVNARNEDDFESFIQKCDDMKLYDTGVSAEYGDRLITLSTCAPYAKNGRMVVVAKQVKASDTYERDQDS